MSRSYNIAIVGATGAVGEEILLILEELKFPFKDILPLASKNSAGKFVECCGKEYKVQELTGSVFDENEIDIAFFCAGGSISERFAPYAVESGAVVIDNTSNFRMDPEIPLVVPECNPQDIKMWKNKGIIANPNCSTIQMVQILKPLDSVFGIERVDVSTYQATSGAGKSGMEELVHQMQEFFAFKLDECEPKKFPHQIALNLFPHIDVFLENDYTKEEMKMVNETRKILHHGIEVSATCVRVPILRSHSEAITIRFKDEIDAQKAKDVLANAPSVVLVDDVSNNVYPMPIIATNKNETFVGRVRKDNFDPRILHLFCAADQIRVGAATNAVRIALKWIEQNQ
ncbi:aspartate-semialdehyde dehydrogenase [Campylobacter corcagiensis]|uniref:Aspartate-semialdehyde dehydrogenase n=1 Tax=Campylobacter corcagiensis TaxID=1448857 RepID=A0A7M1LFG5_9BACT|nr:aspartate-semialdehyde dehydrogenase [Campylobacter corcagiensis]QKF65227.1 aspartate-semialdehyde dehydrogenase [Campylobacter corcagiensis]QOQ86636.1 aspartate-semialdehyde dehydrogenase [Campylobacter corcagiensis]